MTFVALLILTVVLALFLGPAVSEPTTIWTFHHSHDDVGWLKTVDGYYVDNVQFIIDSYVDALLLNPERKFIQVEQGFFTRWWGDQSTARQNQVRQLVKSGQLSFILGGYVMNDEATPSLYGIIDQMTEGHEFILNEFGSTVRGAHHIDPFGQSSAIASLWNMTGFEFYVINRIDWRTKQAFSQNGLMEFTWQPNPSLGSGSKIFAHVLDHHYCSPDIVSNWEYGFYGNGDVVVSTAPSPLTSSNLLFFADTFYAEAVSRKKLFVTSNVLIPIGCDFTHQNAMMQFLQFEKIMNFINANPQRYNGTRVRYSNLLDYYAAIQTEAKAKGLKWPVFTGDFFPYADNAASYWTGYFSSRENVKHATRFAESSLRATEAAAALAWASQRSSLPFTTMMQNISAMRVAHATVQHHDGVSGTEKYFVSVDYLTRLDYGAAAIRNVTAQSIVDVLAVSPSTRTSASLSQDFSDFTLNILNGFSVPIIVSNPQGQSRFCPIEIVLSDALRSIISFRVVDAKMQPVPQQLSLWPNGTRTLTVLVSVPPLGVNTVFVQSSKVSSGDSIAMPVPASSSVLENSFVRLTVDDNGEPVLFENKASGLKQVFNVQLLAYNSSEDETQPSGAYIFRPAVPPIAQPLCSGSGVSHVVSGPVFSALVLNYSACTGYNSTVILRVWSSLPYEESAFLDASVRVGPLDTTHGGREAVVRFVTDIQSNSKFYTDDNGYLVLERTRNLAGRPQDLDAGVALAGNFYPSVTRTYIQAAPANTTFTVVSRASHAVSSLADGQIELMVSRRLRLDDYRGVDEPLNESTVTTQPFWLSLETSHSQAKMAHLLTAALNNPVQVWIAKVAAPISTPAAWLKAFLPDFAPVSALPAHLELLTFKIRSATKPQLVIRLYHRFAIGEDPSLSRPVQIDLAATFAQPLGVKFLAVDETTLTLSRVLSRLKTTSVTISPKEIRSFVITVDH